MRPLRVATLLAGSLLAALGGAFAGCGSAFVPQSQIESLRVLAVKLDTPYAKPGASVHLDMLYYDGSRRAFDPSGKRIRAVNVLWIGGCDDPIGDLYYACFPVLARQFASASALAAGASGGPPGGGSGGAGGAGGGVGGTSPLKRVMCGASPPVLQTKTLGLGSGFTMDIPADIITRRPPPSPTDTPYGLSYAFFAACGGYLGPAAANGDEAGGGLPIGCYDCATDEALGPDDFVIGYTPVYAYDMLTDTNPIVSGGTFDGALQDKTCDQGCPAGTACGSSGLCLPLVPHCTSQKLADCASFDIKPTIDQKSVEKDTAAPPINGRVPDKVIWVAYFATNGSVDQQLRLVNDATMGWNEDYGTSWSPPGGTAGETRIWAIVHDNRGGANWWWQDVIVQ